MSMRVYELAKALAIPSKELIEQLHDMDLDINSHMSALDDDLVAQVCDEYGVSVQDMEKALEEIEAPKAEPEKKAEPEPAETGEEAVEDTPPPAGEEAAEEAEESEASEAEPKTAEAVEAPPEKAEEPATEASAEEAAGEEAEAPAEEAPAPEKAAEVGAVIEEAPSNPVITISGPTTVKDLASKMGLRPNQLVAELMRMNILASINEKVDVETARKVAIRHGFMIEVVKRAEPPKPVVKPVSIEEEEEEDRPEDLHPRPPVVTFLGHVDHGKTSLLDMIRSASVAGGEAGGITQHIGAYTIETESGRITFLDTPGHEAFTSMRARGANLTDIAVIVIAADDGVMPQTREAIRHAKASDVTVMVAINKTDLPGANVEQVKQQLLNEELTPEDWGGDVICVPVSAMTGEGMDNLLQMIALQAEVLDLKANPKRKAKGFVIEAQLEQGMGPTANLLVTAGTLKLGDVVLCGPFWGRVRALINDHGVKVKSAVPATPVRCMGLSGVPEAGAAFRVVGDEKAARAAASDMQEQQKTSQLQDNRKTTLENLFDHIEDSRKLELKVIVKADTQGSLEAICNSLRQIESDKVSLSILLSDTGNITVNDIMLASASDAVVIGFHVGKEGGVPAASKHEGVQVYLHQVIYELLDQVREAMTGLLAPKMEERDRGKAVVKQVFDMGKRVRIAGCLVTNGRVRPSYRVRVRRGPDILYDGAIVTLKHFQDEVSEVREAQECGIRLDNFVDFAEGDLLEFYEVEAVQQTL